MSPAADNVMQRLDAARQKWWFCSLLTTSVLALCTSLGVFLALTLADSFLKFSQSVLLVLLLAWLAMSLAILAGVGRRLLRGQRSIEAAARRVETEFPDLGSNLINVVQLCSPHAPRAEAATCSPHAPRAEAAGDASARGACRLHSDRAFCEAAVRQAAASLGSIAFDRAACRQSRWRRFIVCMQTPRDTAESLVALTLLIAVAAACEASIPNFRSAASRLLKPWRFVPSVGSVEILGVRPGNIDVLIGSSLEIAAEIKNPEGQPHRAVLLATPDKQAESPLAMAADENRQRYRLTVPSILKPFTYRLEIGDSQTQVYAVGVREKPVVEGVEVTFRYPAYLGRKGETRTQETLDLEAPQYTVAELRLRTSTPVAKGYIESGADRFVGRVEEGGKVLAATMPLSKSGSYTVRLLNDAGHSDPNPRVNRITVLPDGPPVVELLKPGRQDSAAPGTAVPVAIRAGDDHGIGRLWLEMKVLAAGGGQSHFRGENAGSEGESDRAAKIGTVPEAATVVRQWTDFAGESPTAAVRRCWLELKRETVKPGQTVLVRAAACDNRAIADGGLALKPQESFGDWHAVKIVAEEAVKSAALAESEGLRGALWKIFEKQVRTRAMAGKPVEKIRTQQIDVQKASAGLAGSIGPSDRQQRLGPVIKRVLGGLAVGDMLQAVARCDELLRLKSPEESRKPAAELIAAQDRIVEVLRKLLDVARHAEADVLAEMKKRPGGDLPEDVRQKLQEMQAKLDEFLKQQKKVIEATENLAKKPTEDFTKEEEEILKGMAAAEDQWAKFIEDLHSDFSKLPEQDFANPSLAKELAEIQTELKMAEDALLKKSADVAVPLEQLGYEMAEELKTNLEKWLPDSPDREKWSQEESPTDKDKEAPMAELPGELEDIVGDLMEQEEDLFDEMEDVGSSAADSLDQGAGWDALDGPISNMSAKGVTGNRLPNTSEIGGRSGEGRQGKSSGEFVGDEAVGKGGRKTPSRLTPDPFVKGQIKDHSKQSAGGATGGGKESGKGGEGLEGPGRRVPGPRDAQRLAGRQAALRNKAEAVDVQFQVANFHHTDLKRMIEIMSQVERDLKAGRYQNALRQRQALLGGLGNVKQRVEGEFEVRQDATPNLPADVQKEILGSMQDPSPAGWEELNRRYFERLGGGGAEPGEKPAAE